MKLSSLDEAGADTHRGEESEEEDEEGVWRGEEEQHSKIFEVGRDEAT